MALKYRVSKGVEYASYARSVRDGGKVRTEYTYIGKVVDRDKGLFYNGKLGYVVFDEHRRRILPAPNAMLPAGAWEDETAVLDFGGCFLIDGYMRQKGIADCIESVYGGGQDTVYALILYYALSMDNLRQFGSWYEGNYASVLYPVADTSLDALLESMTALGSEERFLRLSDMFFDILTDGRFSEDDAVGRGRPLMISIDGQDVDPDMDMPLTHAYSGMSAKDRNLSMLVVYQADSDIPVYYRYVPDRLLRVAGISQINKRMESMGAGVNFALMDSEYCTFENVRRMCRNGISFVTFLPEDTEYYGRIIGRLSSGEGGPCTVCERNDGRYLVSDVENGLMDEFECYVYAVQMPDRTDPGESAVKVVISSKRMEHENAASVCHVRNLQSSVFRRAMGLVKGTEDSHKVTAETIRGHMIVSYIASMLVLSARGEVEASGLDPVHVRRLLVNHKCKVYRSRVVPMKPNGETEELYRKMGLDCPAVIARRS